MDSGMEGAKQWLDLAPALSSRRGRIIGRLTENPQLVVCDWDGARRNVAAASRR